MIATYQGAFSTVVATVAISFPVLIAGSKACLSLITSGIFLLVNSFKILGAAFVVTTSLPKAKGPVSALAIVFKV